MGCPLAVLNAERFGFSIQELPPQWSRGNPVDIIGDAPPERFAAATAALLADPGVDALLVMYSPVAVTAPEAAARAVAAAAQGSRKPVLAAWLGDINPNESRALPRSAGHPKLLHAGERGRGVLFPVRAPAKPGAAHGGADGASACTSRPLTSGRRRAARYRARARPEGPYRGGGERCSRRSACRCRSVTAPRPRPTPCRGPGDRLSGGAEDPVARRHAQVRRRRRAPGPAERRHGGLGLRRDDAPRPRIAPGASRASSSNPCCAIRMRARCSSASPPMRCSVRSSPSARVASQSRRCATPPWRCRRSTPRSRTI